VQNNLSKYANYHKSDNPEKVAYISEFQTGQMWSMLPAFAVNFIYILTATAPSYSSTNYLKSPSEPSKNLARKENHLHLRLCKWLIFFVARWRIACGDSGRGA